jgi:hypothetical protein
VFIGPSLKRCPLFVRYRRGIGVGGNRNDVEVGPRGPLGADAVHLRHGAADRGGAIGAGAKDRSMLDLHDPEMNWSQIARGFGVEASRATTCEEFAAQYASAMQQRGPRLIEVLI